MFTFCSQQNAYRRHTCRKPLATVTWLTDQRIATDFRFQKNKTVVTTDRSFPCENANKAILTRGSFTTFSGVLCPEARPLVVAAVSCLKLTDSCQPI